MRTGRTDIAIPAHAQQTEDEGKADVSIKVQRGKKKSCPSLAVKQKESLLLNLFVLFRPSTDQTRLAHIKAHYLIYSVYSLKS